MKMTKRARLSIAALTCAVSFLNAAPVMAAEKTDNAQKTAAGSYVSGLSEKNKTENNDLSSKTGIVKEGDKTYYLNQFGEKETGLKEENGKKYFFNNDGTMASGFVEVNGSTYYFSRQNGEMLNGKIDLDGKSYYLQEDGELITGWKTENGQKKYYEENGAAVKNAEKTINGKRYAFDEQGVMLTNSSKNGYDYGQDGVGTPNKSAYQKIADAALAQVGVMQDCTMLVTNSLRAVGINFHGWPEEYLSLGPTTNNPVPGDIIVYSGHVAIYIGDGKAVHGGFMGNQTKIWTVECTNPFIAFVHPTLP
ncbi:NlpC/P60 family protein [Ileibacterium valens]|uniref:NlpC/P60 domain-containing protein n=1 Tax=Ileibacterium valens TaxID=1862668 RepID=A0A1U7NEP2_9FIRM|nr:NlpC/P60 family protein [Ileibacterium valens]OLU38124.1 hypothetical protein BO224_09740 [Erysipelotrichaceae bacterium NYU-BL-E8]OLU38218.1 hypothetical protein BO222_08840 [Ileibacterium valens]